MSASAEYQGATRQFMVDSGFPLDLLSSDDLTPEDRKYTRKICNNITLHTANGLTKVSDAVSLSVTELAEPICAHLLGSTPNVVSMGHRCLELGYTFIWRARRTPFLICPSGKKIDLVVKRNVPYLPPSECWQTRSTGMKV